MFSFNREKRSTLRSGPVVYRILGTLPAMLLLGSMATLWAHPPAQAGNQESTLEPGKPIERELAGGQSHAYRINLTSGQFLHAVVEQRGINVALSLFGPDGKQLIKLDNREPSRGAAELILWIAEEAGSYRLEVRSVNKEAVAGRYEMKLEEPRQARPQDASRVDAQKIFAEGEQLRTQGTAESLQRALQKYEAALPHWRAASDQVGEALTLNSAGTVYFLLGESQKSIDCLNQALSLFR